MSRRKLPKSALILVYLQVHLGDWVRNDDVRRVCGLDDVPRAVRQLRQDGYRIEVDRRGNTRLADLDPGQPNGVRGRISWALSQVVLERDGYRCVVCGRTDALVIDHIVAVDSGGPTVEENLQVLCEPHNREKAASLVGVQRLTSVLKATLSQEDRQALINGLLQ